MKQDVGGMFDVGFAAMEGAYGWLVQALAILLFVVIFNFFIKALLVKLCLRFERLNKVWEPSFVKALYRPLSAFVWLVAAVYSIDIITLQLRKTPLYWDTHLLISVGAILSLSWFLLRWNHNVIHVMIIKSKRHQIVMEQGKIDIIGKLLTLAIIFITILMLMEVTQRSMQTIIAFGGIGGLALAFASQEVVSNFFGGLMIYFTHPFSIGDWIKLPERNIEGIIEEIGWYMTLIRSFDKQPIYVPNSIFSKVVVINPSRMTHRQIKEIIGLRYCDRAVVKKIMGEIKNMLAHHPNVDHLIATIVNFDAYGASSLNIMLSTYTQTTDGEAFGIIKEDILLKVGDIIESNGAEFAFPTSTIEISKGISLNS